MRTEPLRHPLSNSAQLNSFPPYAARKECSGFEEPAVSLPLVHCQLPVSLREANGTPWETLNCLLAAGFSFQPCWNGVSHWSGSMAKRVFDCTCVLLAFPLVLPLMLAIAAAVRFTSRGPVLFLQERVGYQGRAFTILKFRTLTHVAFEAHHPNTTSDNQRCTSIGPFLRRWKLDEVPQLINVLLGHMSLVGPRPKLREYVVFDLPCRPGITGMATIAFAREQLILARLPKEHLETYIHSAILPAKQRLDSDYMARATFLSDLRLIFNTLLRRWDAEAMKSLHDVANVIDLMQRRGRSSGLDLKLMEVQLAIGQMPAQNPTAGQFSVN